MSGRAGWFDRWLEASGFVARFPHYAGVLARMDPRSTTAVDAMAVALRRPRDSRSRVDLMVNTAYFERHPEFMAGVLLHEIQHVVLGHLTNERIHSVEAPRVMELAMEVSANEPITDPLPPGVHLRDFEPCGLRAGQSTMERYALLLEAFRDGRLVFVEWEGRMVDSHRPGRGGASIGAGLGDSLDRRSDRSSSRNWNRALGAPTHPETVEQMKRAILDHLRGRGGADDPTPDGSRAPVSKELDRALGATAGRALDWPRVLAAAFPRRRAVQPDHRRVNRRFPHRLGEVPGRARRPPRPRLLVGVDTSGSMDAEALGRVARELGALARVARLTVVECDAAVLRVYGLGARVEGFVGGGDTDFAPVFEHARRDGGRHDGVVYFTDGKGEFPTGALPLPTLWVLTHEDPFDAPDGAVVRLRDGAASGEGHCFRGRRARRCRDDFERGRGGALAITMPPRSATSPSSWLARNARSTWTSATSPCASTSARNASAPACSAWLAGCTATPSTTPASNSPAT